MRKKLFAIVMSMTMVASFMPSLAFAATEHSYLAVDSYFTVDANGKAEAADPANQAKVDKYVEVVKAPTHTEKGVVKVKCSTPLCEAVETFETATVSHQDPKKCANKDFTLDELGDQMYAQRNVTGALKDSYSVSEEALTKWKNDNKGKPAYCYMKDVKVCSCGVIVAYGTWQGHANTGCKDEKCGECGVLLKATAKHKWVNDDPAVEVAADCGNGAGHKATCSVCGAKGVNYDGDSSVSATATHKFGTAEKAADATVKEKAGTNIVTKVKAGYVAVSNSSVNYGVDATVLVPGETVTDTEGYDFFKYNTVVNEPTCTGDGIGTLTCTVCGKNLKDTKDSNTKDVEIPIAKTGHDWEKTDVAATCDSNAYVHKVCKVCKKVDDTEFKANTKLAHSYKVTSTAASCKGGEVYTIECTTCEKDCRKAKSIVKAPGALEVFDENADSVTVLWRGEATHDALSRKDAIQLTFTKKPVDHKYGKKELLKAADCENDEVWGYKCTECGKIAIHDAGTHAPDEKLNTALGHDHPVVSVAATCVNKAYEAKAAECTRCGKVDKDIVKKNEKALEDAKIAGGKHAFDKWVVTKASTVFEEGVKTLTCSACGAHDATKTVIAKKTVAKASNTLKAGKKSLTVKATAANATGYRVYYKKAGAKSWKSYTKKTDSLSKTFSKLSKGKYYVKVKAYAKNYAGDGEVVWGATSATKTVKVK